jgi:hypothetical protein
VAGKSGGAGYRRNWSAVASAPEIEKPAHRSLPRRGGRYLMASAYPKHRSDSDTKVPALKW